MTLSKNEIRLIRSLSSKKYREKEGLFIVEGEKLVDEATRSGFTIEKTIFRNDIGDAEMAKISLLSTPSPVMAILRIPEHMKKTNTANNGDIRGDIRTDRLSIALDGVRDPGNMGTIIRLSDWFGIDALYLSEDCVDIFNPKVIQATMGAIFRVRMIYTDLKQLCSRYASAGSPVYGTFLDGENIYKGELSENGLIIMGNEGDGISPEIAGLVDRRLFIPPYPENSTGSESLNVATATAVICSEFRRRI